MPAARPPTLSNPPRRQRGVALMIMLVIMVVGAAAIFVASLNSSAIQIARDKTTADALAKAKDALVGYAASVALIPNLASPRPGNLPCPDITNTGIAAASCSGNAVGRLPWKTLGLPDLRDGSGERLWYAVSRNFIINPPTSCTAPGQTGCLNSDTAGTITVRSSDGNIINNGCTNYGLPNCPIPGASDAAYGTGVAAVIIAPGDVLQRQGGTLQNRSSAGINTASNYLDIVSANGSTWDNAAFADGSSTNGFVQGTIKDNNGNPIVNDQLLAVTQGNIMQATQKRVAAEVRRCLSEYASPANGGFGRYPWAAKLDPTQAPNYSDTSNQLFGRIPDSTFNNTRSDGDGLMNDTWTGSCNINSSSGWWLNWKEMVFYGLASAYEPIDPPGTPPACGTCLVVNPPSSTANKQFVVIVAGRTLPGQVRISNADKGKLNNYLELPNSAGSSPFAQGAPSAVFNDTVVFQ